MGRFFGIVKGYEEKEINLPQRATKHSAGYDFEAAEDIEIVPIWRTLVHNFNIKPQLIPTGIKASMEDDEGLFLYNRSSNPLKRFLMLANGVGVVDSDYFENEDNDGHIHFPMWNFGIHPVTIKKGERIGQGVFQKFLLVDDETTPKRKRVGGTGSTGTK